MVDVDRNRKTSGIIMIAVAFLLLMAASYFYFDVATESLKSIFYFSVERYNQSITAGGLSLAAGLFFLVIGLLLLVPPLVNPKRMDAEEYDRIQAEKIEKRRMRAEEIKARKSEQEKQSIRKKEEKLLTKKSNFSRIFVILGYSVLITSILLIIVGIIVIPLPSDTYLPAQLYPIIIYFKSTVVIGEAMIGWGIFLIFVSIIISGIARYERHRERKAREFQETRLQERIA